MCYSKEVSLAVGVGMIAVTAYSWRRFTTLKPAIPPAPAPPRTPVTPPPLPLQQATRSILLAHFCLAGHQLFEAAALQFQSELTYKLGLIVSISCMLFLMRSLHQLTRARYSAGLYGFIVTLLVVHVFTRDTEFSNRHFWVRGEDHKVWGAAWIYLFFFWNMCIRDAIEGTADKRNRWLLRAYAWGLLNVSFVLSLGYAFVAMLTPDFAFARSLWRVVGLGVPSEGYNIFQDLPSVWCVFSAIQVLLAPFVLAGLHRGFRLDPRPTETLVPWLERAKILLKTAALTALLYYGSPLIREVGLRMFVK